MASGAVALTPNPDGCTIFEPNAFKKEKCKHCGRLWTEHEGVIAKPLLERFFAEAAKAAGDKKQAEEEAQKKARAKAQAKKKKERAAEDDWLFDAAPEENGHGANADADSDDDGGFRMITPGATERQPSPEVKAKPLKVVNLIDFGECDVVEESEGDGGGGSTSGGGGGGAGGGSFTAASSSLAVLAGAVSDGGPGSAGGGADGSRSHASNAGADGFGSDPTNLLEEIHHLRQMLADAKEEKSIEVAIVRDEVTEKQRLIDDLAKHRAEAEAALKDARAQLDALQGSGAGGAGAAPELAGGEGAGGSDDAGRAAPSEREVARWREEAEATPSLRTRISELERDLEIARAAAATAEAKAAAARAEAEKARIEAAAVAAAADATASKAESPNLAPPAEPGTPSHEDLHVVAQEMSRKATLAVREIREYAEQQLAWLKEHQRERLDLPMRPDAVIAG